MAPSRATQCTAQSATHRAVLVELYTADACNACLAADRWLAGLSGREGLLPFALHVDQGDYTGTKRGVLSRQRKLTVRQRMALVYVPQVMLQGRDFRGWNTGAFDRAADEIKAGTPPVSIHLEIVSLGSQAMTVRAAAEPSDSDALPASWNLYLAAFETQPQRRLILEWQGPLALTTERELTLLPGAAPARSGVAAFVQDRGRGEVLQALALPACPDTFGYIRPK